MINKLYLLFSSNHVYKKCDHQLFYKLKLKKCNKKIIRQLDM